MKNMFAEALDSLAFAYRKITKALEILVLKKTARAFFVKKPQLVKDFTIQQYPSHSAFTTTK